MIDDEEETNQKKLLDTKEDATPEETSKRVKTLSLLWHCKKKL